MSIALKYTTFKDADIPLAQFRAERKRLRVNRKTAAIVAMTVLAVTMPLLFVYALVGPEGYRTWSLPQGNESAFLQEYASTPVPAQPVNDFLSSQSGGN